MKRASALLLLGVVALALTTLAAGAPRRAPMGARPAPEGSAGQIAPRAPTEEEPCAAVLERVVAHLGVADEALGDADRDALFHDARALGRLRGTDVADTCRAGAFAALRGRDRCGRAEAAVAGGLVGASGVSPGEIRALVEGALPGCAATFAEAAGFAADVDASLASALLERARTDPEDGVRRSAWLAYGSVAEIASRVGREEVRSEVEQVISAELAKSAAASARGGRRAAARQLLAVRTAGNAGCRPCLSNLLAAASSKDADLRRNAVAALRFQGGESSAQRMCRAVERDADPSVRELAAWALSFRYDDAPVRVTCLYRAATTDQSARVRISATQSLGGLSDELALGYAALVQLTSEDAPADVRAFALRLLATDPQHGRRDLDEREIAWAPGSARAETALP